MGRWFVACDDDLLILIDERLERIAEFLFEIEPALQELDIIDEQDIERPVEALHPLGTPTA